MKKYRFEMPLEYHLEYLAAEIELKGRAVTEHCSNVSPVTPGIFDAVLCISFFSFELRFFDQAFQGF